MLHMTHYITYLQYINTFLYMGAHTYIWWSISQPLKKKEILTFVTTWMNLKGIMLSEISQAEKDKRHMEIA